MILFAFLLTGGEPPGVLFYRRFILFYFIYFYKVYFGASKTLFFQIRIKKS